MTFSSYIIHHFDLAKDGEPPPSLSDGAHYCVFWYRSIPLGEAYLSVETTFTPDDFWNACAHAITPAIRRYGQSKKIDLLAEIIAFPSPATISKVCGDVLADLAPGTSVRCGVSVVICTRDRPSQLKLCLEHLQRQHCPPAEIIVVDNASVSDETRRVAEAFGVRYVREDRPGLDVARNRGARAATASIVAYADDDTQADTYWTYRVYETFRDPSIAAMTGLVIAGSLKTEAEVIFEKFWPFNRGYLAKTFDGQFFRSLLGAGPPVWEIGAGANMAFRKAVFAQIGYFDERLDAGAAGCSGDSELWYRALAHGLKIRYNPLAVVYHYHRNSMSGLRKQLYAYMRGFTVAMLIQHQRFGHRGNLRRLFRSLPRYYLRLLRHGFPYYSFQYKTVFSEMSGVVSGFLYYLRHRNTDPNIYGNDAL